jgi:histidinol-phosphate aminotransferase
MKPQDLVRPEILALKAYPVPSSDGMVKLDAMENPYRAAWRSCSATAPTS